MSFFGKLFGVGKSADIQEIIAHGAFLVDVRTPGEFAHNQVKGSVNIPLDKIQLQIGKFMDKNNIVVFCRSGNRSLQAKSILAKNGYTNVVNGGSWENVKRFIK